MNGQSTSGTSRQWGMQVEGMCRNYGGGPRKLQLALEHPELKPRFYALLAELAAEREQMLPLLERGPKWTVQVGTFADNAAMIEAIEAKGYKIGHWTRDLLGKIQLEKEPVAVEAFEITPGDVGFTDNVRRDVFYAAVEKLGFIPIEPEVGPQALLQFSEKFELDVWRVIGSQPIVGSDEVLRLFRVGRYSDVVWLSANYGGPDEGWSPDYRFLFRRK
ncbi:MAG: hypothetical protein CEO22_308 [Candidatus Berkelbacteria bacterium Gr01-1014_85]|uniref:Uncharacterized protein n=1 Tax=Candidatus Berkelbacteria bacterium Gr01-1014_85 TaxID=2017150 RepID=A0A554JC48_9BACT|nr:MAG: hypothetical protein CEO22_308 [Candidatus Berkelbacteria bacterium Gr01-1014_85]